MVYSGKNRITGTANKVNIDALTTVSERIDFLLCQSQDHPVSHKAAHEAKPLKIKGCQQLFAMFILKHRLAKFWACLFHRSLPPVRGSFSSK